MKNALFALLAVLALPATGFCGTDLSTNQVQTLKDINTKIGVVHELANRHLITDEQAAAATNQFCQDGKQIVGHDVTPEDIQTLVSNADKTEGLGVFWNIVVVAAGILFLLALLGLISYYLRDLLTQIPVVVYELFAYIGTAALALSGYVQPFHLGFVMVEPLWFVIPGALALAGCLFLSYNLHFKSEQRRRDSVYMGPGFINFPTVMFGICTVAWAAMAVVYHHILPDAAIPHVLAFGAVIALQAALSFSVVTMPGCIALGWDDERQVPKSVFSSLIILAGYVALKLSNVVTGDLTLFEPGAIFMGAFVYFLGLLVMSSKWYCWSGKSDGRNNGRYLALQVVTILSGVAALYFGSVFHLGALLGVGGTFFAIYLLEKYYEIPWKGVGWAWSLLGVAAFLYFVVGFANTHSQYFVWAFAKLLVARD